MHSQLTYPHTIQQRLKPVAWSRMQQEHRKSISTIVDPYLKKRSRQTKDPVLDFLFEYYHFRPVHLKRWSPGLGTTLILDGRPLPEISELTVDGKCAWMDPGRFPANRVSSLHWILDLLENTSDRPPSFGCFGMHEWAMVYKADQVRHSHLPLRMDEDELARFVESRPLVCTHFDAFRFFTDEARPMNRYRLNRKAFQEAEQAGCLHTNMDLYKWSFKMYPWVASDVIRKAFLLAVEARTLDMQASPYDLRSLGLDPVRIETEEGRMQYLKKQRRIFEKAIPVRKQLIDEYRKIVKSVAHGA